MGANAPRQKIRIFLLLFLTNIEFQWYPKYNQIINLFKGLRFWHSGQGRGLFLLGAGTSVGAGAGVSWTAGSCAGGNAEGQQQAEQQRGQFGKLLHPNLPPDYILWSRTGIRAC